LISGKVYQIKTSVEAWKQFRIKYEAGKKRKIQRFVKNYEKRLRNWKKHLKRKLSDKLPKKYWHKRRPNAGSRLFPYKNTGALKKSIQTGIKKHLTEKGNLSIVNWVEIASPYAVYLDQGRPHRSNGEKVGWEGWVYDVVFGEGRGGLISVSDIFKEMNYERKLF
jgi:hypothetical protein